MPDAPRFPEQNFAKRTQEMKLNTASEIVADVLATGVGFF
jgi:hypothetical protein